MPGQATAARERAVRTSPDRLIHYDVSKPTLTHYRAGRGAGLRPAVLICPGGGYEFVSWINEGTEVAEWFVSRGVEAFILKYRVPDNCDGALADAQRALSLIRSRAKALSVDATKVGQIGFSAGANLTARTATHHDRRAYDQIDEVDGESCRPDFSVLVYPWMLVIGENSEKELPLELRKDFPVTGTTPPVFIVQTEDDFAHVENSLAYYAACKRAKVQAEMHLYPKGGHGYGMRRGPQCEGWQCLMASWLKRLGVPCLWAKSVSTD